MCSTGSSSVYSRASTSLPRSSCCFTSKASSSASCHGWNIHATQMPCCNRLLIECTYCIPSPIYRQNMTKPYKTRHISELLWQKEINKSYVLGRTGHQLFHLFFILNLNSSTVHCGKHERFFPQASNRKITLPCCLLKPSTNQDNGRISCSSAGRVSNGVSQRKRKGEKKSSWKVSGSVFLVAGTR